jgi:hypothetical protein
MATKMKPPRNAAPKEDERVKIINYTCNLKVILKAAEIADRADRAAQLLEERDGMEEQLKAQVKHVKSIIDEKDARLRKLSNEVRTRSTYTDVKCERRLDFAKGILECVRTDTGEVLESRRLNDAEMQMELFPGSTDPTEANGEPEEDEEDDEDTDVEAE